MSQNEKIHILPASPRLRQPGAALPRLPAGHIDRPRLAQRLLAGDQRLNLLCAPAGFGKSVLLGECARQAEPDVQVVWLDLHGQPLEPRDLLARLAGALHMVVGDGAAQVELERLLERVEQPLWIFLDDYPRQPCAELDACLDCLLQRGSPQVRWWIGGRRRPAWNLPRLLLQGELQEVDAQSLALDAEELERLLAQRRLELSGDLRERLLQHSSGWPAGIGLLLLDGNADGLAQRIAAGTPLLSEYLEREVLAGLPDSLREALDTLAHMPRFNAALCEHLLEGRDGMEALHTLQRNLLFLENVDNRGEWFRLWRPLADTLKRLAGRRTPLQAHLRACQWFASRGEIREAVEHALHAEQPEAAISLLQRYGNDQMMIGQSAQQFLQWREELPGELFAGSPQLILRNAWALIICARLDEVDACMQNMARFLPQPSARCQQQLLAHYQTVIGVVQRQRGLPSARQNCLEALAALSERAWAQRILCLQSLAQQAMAEGDLDAAGSHVQEGLRLSRQHGNRLFEALLGVESIHLLGMRGEHERALILAEQILQDLPASGQQGPMLARLRLLRGCLLAIRGDDTRAREELDGGVAAAERCADAYLLFGYLVRFLLAVGEGDLPHARYLLCKAERQMQLLQVPQVFYRDVLQLAEARLCLEQGNPESALAGAHQVLRQLDEQSLLAPLGFYDIRLRTRQLAAAATLRLDRPADAVAQLRPLLEDCRQGGYHSLASECHLLLAEALHLAGLSVEADGELLRAVAECERLGMAQPLRALQRRQPQWQVLLRTDKVEICEARQDSPLSNRETAVLELIAQGCSNREIAERLRISLHTVKTHARRINVKLGLERRTQAVAMAKAEGWLRT